jgi:hypothetical protein
MSTPTPRAETPAGPNRTPRSEITALVSGNRQKEPAFLIDVSGSMDWSARDENDRQQDYPGAYSRRQIVLEALPLLVSKLEGEDSQAATEQAGGSDDEGGVYTVAFSSGEPQDVGDLNSSNIQRKLAQLRWGGGTHVVPGLKLAIADYDEEFGDRTAEDKPVHEIMILTDGAAEDWQELEDYLQRADAHRVYAIAIVGHGDTALKVAREYQRVAEENKRQDKFGHQHVTVVNFDGETNPTTLAEDLMALIG